MADRVRAAARRPSRPWTWRTTNLALFGVLALAFLTGVAAQATGSARGAWVAVVHGVVGLVVVALVPRKGRVAAGGLRRRRPGRWVSVGLAGADARDAGRRDRLVDGPAGHGRGGRAAVDAHRARPAAPAAAGLARRRAAGPPRAVDLGRRTLMRAGLLAAAGGALYAGLEGAVRIAGLPGAQRRFTGSHAVDPARCRSRAGWTTPCRTCGGALAAGRDRRGRDAEPLARRAGRPGHDDRAGDAGLHVGLVRHVRLDRCAGRGCSRASIRHTGASGCAR